ncbi:SelT/SelW/SelH family protein [Pedobacter sp. GSP4]|uniref:SelT/SelW/SelH family protein n=1 Tax=Pedobacter sp. GSP4 TaxID=3453716 RepID=UPI003EEEAA5B
MEKPLINITYCPKCGWMLRSAYMAQEILTTFTEEIKGVALLPSETAGVFTIKVDEKLIFDRKQMQRFPEIKELKQLIRDEVNPSMHLGHSDVNK